MSISTKRQNVPPRIVDYMEKLSRIDIINGETHLRISPSGVFFSDCEGGYAGRKLDSETITLMRDQHLAWLRDGKKDNDNRRANLCYADLRAANLQDADLRYAHLDAAVLEGADLSKANLQNATLVGSFLADANLEGADLRNSHMVGADLRKANLRGTLLHNANLQMVYLGDVNLEDRVLNEANLVSANLDCAHLRGAFLSDADLRHAHLNHADLRHAYLDGADLSGGYLQGTDLKGAILTEAKLKDAHLVTASLHNASATYAILRGADLSGAGLHETKLQGADLQGVVLTGAKMGGANLSRAYMAFASFDLAPDSLPNLQSIARANNLSLMHFSMLPHALVELRDEFKKAGLLEQEGQITYAIERTKRRKLWSNGGWIEKIESAARYFAFEYTSHYGMSPGRILRLFSSSILFFSVFYLFALLQTRGRAGIWAVGSPDRIDKNKDEETPVRLPKEPFPWRGRRENETTWHLAVFWLRVMGTAMYFSVLSAFHIGWRDFNIRTWISRMQPGDYTLEATGWVRTVAGFQSMISVYLVALWTLTYFGSPFE